MGDFDGHPFRGNQYVAGGGGVSRGDWGSARTRVANDDPKRVGQDIAEALGRSGSLTRSGLAPERVMKNWNKEFKGRIVTDPQRLAILKEGIAENEANPIYSELVRIHGDEGVIVLALDTNDPEKMVGGGHAGQRLGVVTAVMEKPGSKFNVLDDKPEKPRPGLSGAGVAATLRHEFGHAIHDRIRQEDPALYTELRDAFHAIPDPKAELTYYAGHSGEHEGFPEAIAIGTHASYNPKEWSPAAAAYIEKAIRAAQRPRKKA